MCMWHLEKVLLFLWIPIFFWILSSLLECLYSYGKFLDYLLQHRADVSNTFASISLFGFVLLLPLSLEAWLSSAGLLLVSAVSVLVVSAYAAPTVVSAAVWAASAATTAAAFAAAPGLTSAFLGAGSAARAVFTSVGPLSFAWEHISGWLFNSNLRHFDCWSSFVRVKGSRFWLLFLSPEEFFCLESCICREFSCYTVYFFLSDVVKHLA